jgi:hypothetical protein
MHKNKNSFGSKAAKDVMCFCISDCTKFAVCPYNPYTVAEAVVRFTIAKRFACANRKQQTIYSELVLLLGDFTCQAAIARYYLSMVRKHFGDCVWC